MSVEQDQMTHLHCRALKGQWLSPSAASITSSGGFDDLTVQRGAGKFTKYGVCFLHVLLRNGAMTKLTYYLHRS